MNIKKILTALILGSTALSTASQGTVITGNASHSINGSDAFVYAYDQATVVLTAGADVAFLHMHDQSHVNLYAGELSWLHLYDQSTADIHQTDISWLLLGGDSIANIYGSDFSYGGGHLSGKWSDESPFSFWALNINSNGQIITPAPASMPTNISLHSVPIPGTLYLLGAALLPLIGFHRKSSRAV
ncbi:MAG: hypothetical protein Q7T90_02780 [Thiobacillus sp.]|nr:hypothetical protein [Thiobacillus sp.]